MHYNKTKQTSRRKWTKEKAKETHTVNQETCTFAHTEIL